MSFDLIIKNGTVILENEARVVDIAVKDGKIKDIVDFYKLQNLQADTEMRRLMAKNYKNDKNED